MTSSKILFFICVAFVAGMFLESVVNLPQYILWCFLLSGVILILLRYILRESSRELILVAGFCLMFLVLGVLRMQISEFNIANDKLSQLNDAGEIILTGTIVDEPKLKDNLQSLKVKVDEYKDMILVTVKRYPEYKYLDQVELIGELETPMETEDFSYKNYLLKDHIYSVMYFPKINKIGLANKNVLSTGYSSVLWIKEKMRQSIRSSFLPPQSSLLEGVLLGDKSAISQDVKDDFRNTGLSHIIAVSGLHIVILSSIIMYILLMFGLWRNQAFYGAIIFILIYVVLVGAPASAVRAGIMGVIYLLGQKLGRQSMSSRTIVLAGALMLLVNPLLLMYDVGFQLSFLAVLGIILLDPIIKTLIAFPAKYENILSLFTVTFSAQIFTLPIIIYNFGSISLVSLFTNILILPVIPGVMLFGFLSAVAGTIWNSLGWLISLPCYFLLKYVFYVVDYFSKPWAYKIIENVSWGWVAAAYLFLGIFTRYLNKRLRTKFLDY